MVDEVEALVVSGRGLRVELVHLLLGRGDEDVAVRALLDLGLQSARRVEVEAHVHPAVGVLEEVADRGEGLREGGGGKDGEGDLGRRVCAGAGGGLRGARAGREAESGGRGRHRRDERAPGHDGAGGGGAMCVDHVCSLRLWCLP